MQSPEQKMSDACMEEIAAQRGLFLAEHAALIGGSTFWIFPPRIQMVNRTPKIPDPPMGAGGPWGLSKLYDHFIDKVPDPNTISIYQEFSQLIALVPPGVSFGDPDFVKRNYPHRFCIVRIEI